MAEGAKDVKNAMQPGHSQVGEVRQSLPSPSPAMLRLGVCWY